ncbi:interferon alpha-H-like [Hippopotamus amphibius kiboko]|uniref:interferon alpha-H-like n=1 Tax=Hippopotamus amphibius kiboko TaxID=575201 RepID=UPI002599C389|nr:interferon alpha-H-like [Hippopotamus amphibius kiboko]
MARLSVLLAAVMLGCTPACCLGCSLPWIHCQQNKGIVTRWKQMQRSRIPSCLKDRADFKFPWKRETIAPIPTTQGPCYHYLMFQQILRLFTTGDSRAAWDNTLLDKLLSSLDQSLKQLEQMQEDCLDCADLGLLARKYFHAIHLYLEDREYSPCAWEALRVEIINVFPSWKNPQRKVHK